MSPAHRPARRVALALVTGPMLLAPLVGVAAPASAASPNLVVSQVYGGGGNSGAPYTHDFIEVFNRGTTAASLEGMSLQYASATGTGNFGANSGQLTELPAATLQPGQYFLVQESGGTTGSALPAPDHVDPTPISMAAASGKVALTTGTTSLGCNGGSTPCSAEQQARIVDLVGYGAANFFEGSAPAPTLSNSTAALRENAGRTDTDDNAADFVAGAPTPRNSGAQPPPPAPLTCGDVATIQKISAVQGPGSSTPKSGQTVEVEAVLTAIRPGLGGYFLEEEPSDWDADNLTSEGIFVSGTSPAGAGEGDLVRVRGTAGESFGRTQISAAGALDCGAAPAPGAAEVTFPLSSSSFLERHEGMLVMFPQDLVISEYFNFDQFNETVVGVPPNGWDRFFTPTAVVEPGQEAGALAADYALRRITLDDGRNTRNPTPPYFPGAVDTPFSLDNRFRGGDTLADVTGVLDFAFSRYRVHPTTDAVHTVENPRPEQPPTVGGTLKVASFNVLNYFLTLDAGPDICGPNQNQDCRGADTAEEFQRQKDKIVDALADLNADVVGLMEMENTPGVEPAADLAEALNARLGAGTYSHVDTGVVGTDAIRVGLLYKPGKLAATDPFAILDSSVDPRFRDDKNRPALAQTFVEKGTGGKVTVVVNHLKSKGSACNDVGDPDTGDGQGNCNRTRTLAAQALVDWLRTDPTDSGDPDFLIIGDLNSYDHEDPIDALVAGGYTDLVKSYGGELAYGYVFDGQAGYLDHALSTDTLTPQVSGAAEWHINADEPDILDYDMSFKGTAEQALYEPNQFRSSDHDAVLVGLDLRPGRSGRR